MLWNRKKKQEDKKPENEEQQKVIDKLPLLRVCLVSMAFQEQMFALMQYVRSTGIGDVKDMARLWGVDKILEAKKIVLENTSKVLVENYGLKPLSEDEEWIINKAIEYRSIKFQEQLDKEMV